MKQLYAIDAGKISVVLSLKVWRTWGAFRDVWWKTTQNGLYLSLAFRDFPNFLKKRLGHLGRVLKQSIMRRMFGWNVTVSKFQILAILWNIYTLNDSQLQIQIIKYTWSHWTSQKCSVNWLRNFWWIYVKIILYNKRNSVSKNLFY